MTLNSYFKTVLYVLIGVLVIIGIYSTMDGLRGPKPNYKFSIYTTQGLYHIDLPERGHCTIQEESSDGILVYNTSRELLEDLEDICARDVYFTALIGPDNIVSDPLAKDSIQVYNINQHDTRLPYHADTSGMLYRMGDSWIFIKRP